MTIAESVQAVVALLLPKIEAKNWYGL
jgi:hypothetical protein